MTHTIQKGETKPINVTKQGNERVFVGLGWDPQVAKNFLARLQDTVTGKQTFHDLDLSCYLYNQHKAFVSVISGKIGQIADESGAIYHSGDDTEGIGGGDDEQISAELANIPDDIHHIIFKATIESGHKFKDIDRPEIRIVDAYTDRQLIKIDLIRDDTLNASTYIFCRLHRDETTPSLWHIHFIDEATNAADSAQWAKRLTQYLTI